MEIGSSHTSRKGKGKEVGAGKGIRLKVRGKDQKIATPKLDPG